MTPKTRAERAAEVAALDAKRTPGEWRKHGSTVCAPIETDEWRAGDVCVMRSNKHWNPKNSAFIAHAPAMAALIAEYAEAEKEKDEHASQLLLEIDFLKAERRQDEARIAELERLNGLAREYDAMPADGGFEAPHPIFQMAEDIDRKTARLAELEAQLVEARKGNPLLTTYDESEWWLDLNKWLEAIVAAKGTMINGNALSADAAFHLTQLAILASRSKT